MYEHGSWVVLLLQPSAPAWSLCAMLACLHAVALHVPLHALALHVIRPPPPFPSMLYPESHWQAGVSETKWLFSGQGGLSQVSPEWPFEHPHLKLLPE